MAEQALSSVPLSQLFPHTWATGDTRLRALTLNTKHSSHLQERKRQFILEARLSDHGPEID